MAGADKTYVNKWNKDQIILSLEKDVVSMNLYKEEVSKTRLLMELPGYIYNHLL